jgi:hypothetical protein
MTKQLSPAAQAVLDAASNVYWDWTDMSPASSQTIAAASLRAAADQLRYTDHLGLTGFGGYTQAQDQILAIADELETQ